MPRAYTRYPRKARPPVNLIILGIDFHQRTVQFNYNIKIVLFTLKFECFYYKGNLFTQQTMYGIPTWLHEYLRSRFYVVEGKKRLPVSIH